MPPTPMGLPPSSQSETPKRTNLPHQVPVNTQFNTVSGSIAAGVVAPPVATAAAGKKKKNKHI